MVIDHHDTAVHLSVLPGHVGGAVYNPQYPHAMPGHHPYMSFNHTTAYADSELAQSQAASGTVLCLCVFCMHQPTCALVRCKPCLLYHKCIRVSWQLNMRDAIKPSPSMLRVQLPGYRDVYDGRSAQRFIHRRDWERTRCTA